MPIRIAIVGVGKIARDQHLPSIAGNRDFELVAAVSRNASVDGVANFPDIESLLASDVAVASGMLAQAMDDQQGAARGAGRWPAVQLQGQPVGGAERLHRRAV